MAEAEKQADDEKEFIRLKEEKAKRQEAKEKALEKLRKQDN